MTIGRCFSNNELGYYALVANRLPFPDIPLPSKFRQHQKAEPTPTVEPAEPESPKPAPRPPINVSAPPMPPTEIPELQIGGELEPEPPKIINKDGYIIEEADYSDYQ